MSGCYSRTIYVGNLLLDIREWEVEDLFYKYGRILDIELKIPPRPPCYCFVEFANARDTEDAIRGRDGYNFDGCHLRVELAHGGCGQSSSGDGRGDYGSGHRSSNNNGCFGVSRHSEYRVLYGCVWYTGQERIEKDHYPMFGRTYVEQTRTYVEQGGTVVVRGLPSSASWQDLKDHMRRAGDVYFAEVSRDSEGTFGLVDYTNYEDMKYAIRKLDDTEFRNPWTKTYIWVRKYDRSPSRSPRRCCSRSRSRSRSRSKSLQQSPSASRSISPVKPTRPRSKSPREV